MKVSWIFCLVPLLAAPAWGQNAANDDVKNCYDLSGDPAIAACTRAIESGQLTQANPAIMYYNRGYEWRAKKEYDSAIADFDQALRLDPKYTSAYNNRGLAWYDKGDYDKAIADFDQALRLDPNHANSYFGRGQAFYAKGEYDKAIADFDQAIRLNPQLSGVYFDRGVAHFSNRDWTTATADFSTYHKLNSKDAYSVLWLALAGLRLPDSGWASRLEEQSKGVGQDWPWPLVRFYGGQLTADQVLTAANDTDATKQRSQLCKAAFYIGEWKLIHGQSREAAENLKKAQSTCPPNDASYAFAVQELKNLGRQ